MGRASWGPWPGSGGGGAGGALFSGALIDSESAGAIFTYAANIGTEGVTPTANQVDPIRFPLSAGIVGTLRAICGPLGTGAGAVTFTVYKNGVATALTCTIAAHSAAYTTASDTNPAHAVGFNAGDQIDIQVSSVAPMGQNVGFAASVGVNSSASIVPAVSSVNGQIGNVTLASSDGGIVVSNPTAGEVEFAQVIQAEWPAANVRWYAVDAVGGNDTNVGFSDVSSADAGTKAKKTLAGLAAIFPLVGANRKVVIVINQGNYSDPLDILLQGVSGYAVDFPLIVATGTNSTAGATAFAGNANDRLFVGAVTATGCNAGGYNPIGAPTQTTVQLAKVGGGVPALPAEPALPLGARFRFDAATTTVALRNFSAPIVGVTTTTTTNDTILLPGVATGAGSLPAAPTTTDTGYIEMPGVNITAGANLCLGGNSPGPGGVTTHALSPQFVGLNLGTSTRVIGGRSYWAFTRHAFFSAGASDLTTTPFNYRDETGVFRQVGPTRSEGISGSSGVSINSNNANAPFFCAGNFSLGGVTLGTLSNGSYIAGLGIFNAAYGLDTANNQPLGSVGARTVNGQSTVRVVGTATVQAKTAGISMQSSIVPLEKIQITSVGANPAIALQGLCAISVTSFLTGSSGNTDVGLDLTGAANSVVLIYSVPTVTGALGDIRLSDGTIISWATAAAGVVDAAGNRLYTPGNAPGHPIPVASGAVTVAITNAPTGSPGAPARYVKFPDGAGGFYTFASLT